MMGDIHSMQAASKESYSSQRAFIQDSRRAILGGIALFVLMPARLVWRIRLLCAPFAPSAHRPVNQAADLGIKWVRAARAILFISRQWRGKIDTANLGGSEFY